MNHKCRSFCYQFKPNKLINFGNDKYSAVENVLNEKKPYWFYFQKPSKTLQSQLAKKMCIPKTARDILFAEEVRSRCIRFEKGVVLIMQGVEPANIHVNENFPTMRFWITDKGVLSLSTGNIEAIHDLESAIKSEEVTDPISALITLLNDLLYYLEEVIYQVDERLNKIETEIEYTEEATNRITLARQDIMYIRGYVFPQRGALTALSNKVSGLTETLRHDLKELSDNMLRQVELIEMMRERAVIIQDNITNQIGEISNRRMYLLTVIMLLFTPAFFIMGLFSMYMPIPGMDSKLTWWIITLVIFLSSIGLLVVFKKRKWL